MEKMHPAARESYIEYINELMKQLSDEDIQLVMMFTELRAKKN